LVEDKSIIKINNVNVGDIAKPASLLIEKISGAIGEIYRPYGIKLLARAESEAELIKAKSQIEITELQRRAFTRLAAEEAKKQSNIEQITEKALNQLDNASKPQDMDDDWITNFFDKCRTVSDEEMQLLWAKILAGEANSPGVYSKRTVNLLNSLDKKDAELFTLLCNFVWVMGGESYPLVLDCKAPIYFENGIDFFNLTDLDTLGLIRFDPVAGFEINYKGFVAFNYHHDAIIFNQNSLNKGRINIGNVMLTKIGKELSRVSSTKKIDGFYKYVLDYWTRKGFGPISINKPNTPTASG
jgi:hypothetical protein